MTTYQKQCLLGYLGYLPPKQQDGIDGNMTRAAEAKFKADFGYNVEALGTAVAQAIATIDEVAPQTNTETSTTVQDGDYWPEIKHFTKDEENITCPCWRCRGKKLYPEKRLMLEADNIRDLAKKPMIPSSVRRCQEHNDELDGSAPNSYHIRGLAMDFDIPDLPDNQIKAILAAEKAAGRVRYWYQMKSGWFHFDVD